jgi:hypothetical protein
MRGSPDELEGVMAGLVLDKPGRDGEVETNSKRYKSPHCIAKKQNMCYTFLFAKLVARRPEAFGSGVEWKDEIDLIAGRSAQGGTEFLI